MITQTFQTKVTRWSSASIHSKGIFPHWVIEHSIEILIFAYNTNAAKTEEEQDTSTQSHLFNHARVNVE